MMPAMVTCPLCGARYRPDTQPLCAACPLHRTCTLTCCPRCGYQQPLVEGSRLARALAQWIGKDRGGTT